MHKYIPLLAFPAIIASCSKSGDINNHQIIDLHEGYIASGIQKEITLSNGLTVMMDQDSVFYIGDMLFNSNLLDSAQTKLGTIQARTNHWSDYNISFFIASGFSNTVKAIIYSGIGMVNAAMISSQLSEVSSQSLASIVFVPDSQSSYSSVGKQPGGNTIHIWNNSSLYDGSVAHEILHTLGFSHEQSREDRDSYVNILWNNIMNGEDHNFRKYSLEYQGFDLGNYDYNSIMHYHSWAFSKDPIGYSYPTITKKDGSTFYCQRSYLTTGDQESIYFLYGPKPTINSNVHYSDTMDDGVTYRSLTEYSNRIRFLDRNNNPVTLASPRMVHYTYHTYDYSSTNPGTHIATPCDIILPAGTTYYYLDDTIIEYHEELGQIKYRHEEYYTIF